MVRKKLIITLSLVGLLSGVFNSSGGFFSYINGAKKRAFQMAAVFMVTKQFTDELNIGSFSTGTGSAESTILNMSLLALASAMSYMKPLEYQYSKELRDKKINNACNDKIFVDFCNRLKCGLSLSAFVGGAWLAKGNLTHFSELDCSKIVNSLIYTSVSLGSLFSVIEHFGSNLNK